MTMPVTLAGAEIGRRSSIRPTAKITAAASSTPSGSELFRNRVENRSICHAAPIAAPKPEEHRDPADGGRRLRVHAAIVRRHDPAEVQGDAPDHGRGDHRDEGRDEADERVAGEVGHAGAVLRRRTA